MHVAVLPSQLAVIVAVPTPTAVTVPFDTVATLDLFVDHETILNDAPDGLTVAVSFDVARVSSDREEELMVIDVTGTYAPPLSPVPSFLHRIERPPARLLTDEG